MSGFSPPLKAHKRFVHISIASLLSAIACFFLLVSDSTAIVTIDTISGAPNIPVAATIRIDSTSSIAYSHMAIGATHTQYSADSGNDGSSVDSAKQLLQNSLLYQNQQIMGWGAGDPEPSPGVYNWSSLDARVQLMRDTQANMVLSLCCAPGWMRPTGYQDDWKDLETAPSPSHVQDFANLTAQVALRYPDVKYFQVWNELKGMWSSSPGAAPDVANANRWDYKRYTTLYNAVYDAIKRVRPDAQIGGPYVVMDSYGDASQTTNPGPTYSWGTLDQRPLDVISYWLKHKHGADFIVVDGSSANNKDHVWRTDAFHAGQKFIDVARWIRQQGNGGATLPIWWAEWYAGIPQNNPHSLQYDNAVMAADEIATLQSGVAVLLVWGPQGNANGFSFPEGIWTDTRQADGGLATPYYSTSMAFKYYFAPGTPLYKATSSTSTISVLASAKATLLVNHLATSQIIKVNGILLKLRPYEVRLLPTPA